VSPTTGQAGRPVINTGASWRGYLEGASGIVQDYANFRLTKGGLPRTSASGDAGYRNGPPCSSGAAKWHGRVDLSEREETG
jgi:hypothetical protein